MDTLFTRLEEASYAGDVNSLKELLENDKLLLEKVIARTSVRDNPLHIAAMLGHADFVREVIYHKPELAKELNGQSLSPLHLAAAQGHVTVVRELLKAGWDLCLLSETKDGLLPLHIAVKKRRTVIVKELVEACAEAVHRLTNGGESILHLAVKYNSFDTVEYLIDRVNNLNAKDDKGNTILHHAVESKQLSVIKFLLNKPTINVNIMNLASLTPLDVLLGSLPQNGDLVLGEMIRAAGGKTAAEVLSEAEPVITDSVSSDRSNQIPTRRTSLQQPHCLSTKNDIEEATLKRQKEKKDKKYDPQILLLVATLVATVTFQAGLNPPGGFIPDDKDHPKTKGHPVLGEFLYNFVQYDMLALFLSVSVMMLLLCVVPQKKNIVMKFLVMVIWFAALSMGMAFTCGISALYDNNYYYYYYNNNDNNNTITTTNNNTNKNNDDDYYYGDYHYYRFLLHGWSLLCRLAISWVVVRLLNFLLRKSGLWEPIKRCFDSLKKGCFLKWQQFENITKINGLNCCELCKKVICIVLILGALVQISCVWVLSRYWPY